MNVLRRLVVTASVLTGIGMLIAMIAVPANINLNSFFLAMLSWTFILTPWWLP